MGYPSRGGANSALVGCRRLAKVDAHQADGLEEDQIEGHAQDFHQPVVLVAGNRHADLDAGAAREWGERMPVPDPWYCVGGLRFFFAWEGRMVVQHIPDFIRRAAGEEAMRAWAARPVQGAVARAVAAGEVAGPGLDLSRFRSAIRATLFPLDSYPRRAGGPFCPDMVLWRMRVYVGGSWTTFRRARHPRVAETGASVELSPELAELCLLCRAGRADGRHVALNCQEQGLPDLRSALYDEAESILRGADEPQSSFPRSSLRHPRGLRGAREEASVQRWPLLSALGWMMPTEG